MTVMPSSCSVVLQMPRGNLETIYPRALVLAGIRKNIIAKDYKKAFLACRSQRVDMNILHDYDPSQFMANVLLFVKQIKKVEHIDLFLSQLRCVNTRQIMTLTYRLLGMRMSAGQCIKRHSIFQFPTKPGRMSMVSCKSLQWQKGSKSIGSVMRFSKR